MSPSPKKVNQIKELYKQIPDHLVRPVRLRRRVVLVSILLAIIFGLLAGFGGGLFVLISRSVPVPFFKDLNLDEYLPRREITIKTEQKVTVTPDERIDKLARAVRGRRVAIFEAKSVAPVTRLLDQLYLEKDALGLGAILTSDGWIITCDSIGRLTSESGLVVVDFNRKVYSVQEQVKDPASGIVFLKIDGSGLPVSKLAENNEVTQGQEVLVFNREGGIVHSVVSQLDWRKIDTAQDMVISSDKFSEFIKLADSECPLDTRCPTILGSPVINLEGSLIGLVGCDLTRVIPTSQFKDIISQVFRNKEIKRPYLGINYLDLAQTIGIADAEFANLKAGALVYGTPEKEGPAGLAGLKNRDVILKVNNDSVDKSHNLTSLIQEYSPENEVELTILREGKQEVVRVKLAELAK